MNESEFAELVDCRLPYHDGAECRQLIDLARSINDQAMFVVLDEICRPPLDTKVTSRQLHELLAYWRSQAAHPLSEEFEDCALKMISGECLTVDHAIKLMRQVSAYPGQLAALSIAVMSCDDVDGLANDAYEKIRANWGI